MHQALTCPVLIFRLLELMDRNVASDITSDAVKAVVWDIPCNVYNQMSAVKQALRRKLLNESHKEPVWQE